MRMIISADFSRDETPTSTSSFWQRILDQEELRQCDSLEKLLVGCEIIAALDTVNLLAA